MLEINILYLIISYIVCTHLKYIFVYPNDYHYCYYNTYYFYTLVSINKKPNNATFQRTTILYKTLQHYGFLL